MRRLLIMVFATAIAAAFAISPTQSTSAKDNEVPPVPTAVQVDMSANKLFRVGHATGTQNYICLPSGSSFKYVLFTPQATLFEKNKQVMTHYFSPNPDQGGTVRATWQTSDTSTVWGEVKDGNASSDPAFVEAGAIAWLKVTIVGYEDGPGHGDKLDGTTFIQRLNTSDGIAPATGCSTAGDVGKQQFVPYTADYFFYKARH